MIPLCPCIFYWCEWWISLSYQLLLCLLTSCLDTQDKWWVDHIAPHVRWSLEMAFRTLCSLCHPVMVLCVIYALGGELSIAWCPSHSSRCNNIRHNHVFEHSLYWDKQLTCNWNKRHVFRRKENHYLSYKPICGRIHLIFITKFQQSAIRFFLPIRHSLRECFNLNFES